MTLLKIILALFTFLFQFWLMIYIVSRAEPLYYRIRYKRGEPGVIGRDIKKVASRWKASPVFMTLFILPFLSGAANLILEPVLTKPEIGAFYEEEYYTAEYEGIIYLSEYTSLPAIFTVEHDVYNRKHSESAYAIKKILLPPDVVREVDFVEYFPDQENTAYLGYGSYDYNYSLTRIADSASYSRLHDFEWWGRDVFVCNSTHAIHVSGCPEAETIQDKRYFPSEIAAELYYDLLMGDCY